MAAITSRYRLNRQCSLLGGYVDTMEVSAPWSAIEKIYDDVRNALSDHAFIMAHFSHAYLDGAAVYFTFAARSPLDEREHYAETWRRASSAAVAAGASVSHHHGIGRGKRDFLAEHHGPLWADYAKLKARFDPDNVLNPGLWRSEAEAKDKSAARDAIQLPSSRPGRAGITYE